MNTNRLATVQMEWTAAPLRCQRQPSFVFSDAREGTPQVESTTGRKGASGVVITTHHVRLDFHPSAAGNGFTAGKLNVSFDLTATARGSWSPETADTTNLKGTLSSTDCYDPPADCAAGARAHIGSGLISRAG